MSSRRLLVLAASKYQIDAIRTAKRIGYWVATTDNVPTNPGHALADASFDVDTTDVDGVVGLARQLRVDGVISPCTDVAVVTAAEAAHALGLPGVPAAAARTLTSKLLFRRFLEERQLPRPAAREVGEAALCAPELFDGRRWLVKPNRSSGSKGVFIVQVFDEFRSRLPESCAFSADGKALLEQYLDGTQHTCEGVLAGGQVAFSVVTDRATAAPPYVATTGHAVPSRLREKAQRSLQDLVEHIFGELGVRDTVFDCDFVADGDGVTIIEITPRLGGNSLSALVRACCDVDLVEYAVRQACGDAPSAPPSGSPLRPTVNCILGVRRNGLLDYDPVALENLRRQPWVRMLELDYQRGTPVERFVNGRHRVGEAILTAATRDELEALPGRLELELQLGVREPAA